MVSSWRNFKIFFLDHFSSSFLGQSPEMLKFHPYSILTGDTRVEFVIYCVLNYNLVVFGLGKDFLFKSYSQDTVI